MLGEAAFLLFREDQLPIGDDVELALLTRRDFGVVRGAFVQLGRETRSPAVITVSDWAVEDVDSHSASLPEAGTKLAVGRSTVR